MDRVQVLKQESTALGGTDADSAEFSVPIRPEEDAVEAAGMYLQETTARDENVLFYRDTSDNIVFQDVAQPSGKTLSDLVAAAQGGGGGLTTEQHKALRQLIHFLEEGPAEQFTTGAYKESLPAGNPFPTSVVWWESSAKLKKIVEKTLTRNASKIPTSVEWKVYGTDGTTVQATVTDVITYVNNVFEASRTRTIS